MGRVPGEQRGAKLAGTVWVNDNEPFLFGFARKAGHHGMNTAIAAAATKGNRGAQQASGVDLGAMDEPMAEEVVAEA